MSQIEAVAAPLRSNPGEVLRRAREEKGWELKEVAAQLHLTAHALTQLEAGEFERLPGHTFARGYVRAYAKLLGLDQTELVEVFDRYTGTDASGSTVHSLGHVPEPLRLSRTVLRLASAVLLILLLALAWFWWQERPERLAELGTFGLKHIEVESADGTTELHPLDELEDQAVAEALEGEPAPVENAPAGQLPLTAGDGAGQATPGEAAGAPVVESTAAAAASGAPTPPPAAAAKPAAVAPASTAAAAAPSTPGPAAAPLAAVAEAAAPLPAAGEGLLQLGFSAECWVQVTDANGRVLLSTVKGAGESLQVTGKAPLELRLGNARGARDVRFNGAAVEHLKNMTASGTARISLGQ